MPSKKSTSKPDPNRKSRPAARRGRKESSVRVLKAESELEQARIKRNKGRVTGKSIVKPGSEKSIRDSKEDAEFRKFLRGLRGLHIKK